MPTGRLHDGRSFQTATLLPNGQVLVAGGNSGIFISGGPSPDLASAEIYHPATGRWTRTGMLNTPRHEHTATLLPNGQVLVTGGFDCTDTTCTRIASAELYNPITGAWTPTGSLITGRDLHTATLLPNGLVLVAGGIDVNHSFTTSAELYDPTTGIWTATGSMNDGRAAASATLLPDGKVLVAGGFNSATLPITPSLSSAELYDPSTGTWTLTGSMNVARDQHTATLLPSGKVLVVGGFTNVSPGPTASAELYDPATGTWQRTDTSGAGRAQHTATLLLNGKVLIAGGAGDNLRRLVLASAELYTP